MPIDATDSTKHRKSLTTILWLLLPILGIVQFYVCWLIAIQYYPGGSPLSAVNQVVADGYLFWQNPFSDLGRCFAWNGESNAQSRSIYTPSLILMALSVLPLAIALPDRIRGHRPTLLLATFTLTLSIFAMVGVALTPYDILLNEHEFFFQSWMVSFSITLFLFQLAVGLQVRERGWRKSHMLAASIATLTMILVALHIAQTVLQWQRQLYIPAQKLVAASCLTWVIVTTLSALFRRNADSKERTHSRSRATSASALSSVAATIAALIVGSWIVFTRAPVPLQANGGTGHQFNHPLAVQFSDGSEVNLKSHNVIGWLSGEIGADEQLAVELWFIQNHESSLLYRSVEIDCERMIPTGLNTVYVSYIPILLAERADFHELESSRTPIAPNALELFHPPTAFRQKFRSTAYEPLEPEAPHVICTISDQVLMMGPESVESIAEDCEGSCLLIAVQREPKAAVTKSD